jgi:hypothetical protein
MVTYVSNGAWGTGQGTPLTIGQADTNIYDLASLIADLQQTQSAAGIDYFVVNGNQLYVHLTNHQVIGPYTLPTVQWVPVGEWVANTASPFSNVNVQFYYAGAAYVVIFAGYPGAATFDPSANDGMGHNYFSPPILVVPEADLPYQITSPLEPNQVLTYTAGNYWTNQNAPVLSTGPIDISSSQLQNLGTSPVLLISAPGADTYIDIVSTTYSLTAGGTPYTGSAANAGLFYGANSAYAADAGDNEVPLQTASAIWKATGNVGEIQAATGLVNKSVSYCNFGGPYEAGNGTMIITVLYRIVSTS